MPSALGGTTRFSALLPTSDLGAGGIAIHLSPPPEAGSRGVAVGGRLWHSFLARPFPGGGGGGLGVPAFVCCLRARV